MMRQLWARYATPIAVTECHLGCSVDEQIRWLGDCWSAALSARDEGIPVEAVTAWALLGSFDWNSLLTRQVGYYEPGAFDLSGGRGPVITPLGEAISQLANGGWIDPHAVGAPIVERGWWTRADRFGDVATEDGYDEMIVEGATITEHGTSRNGRHSLGEVLRSLS
jgi:dTDP-4-dehydrorhamnose reductase